LTENYYSLVMYGVPPPHLPPPKLFSLGLYGTGYSFVFFSLSPTICFPIHEPDLGGKDAATVWHFGFLPFCNPFSSHEPRSAYPKKFPPIFFSVFPFVSQLPITPRPSPSVILTYVLCQPHVFESFSCVLDMDMFAFFRVTPLPLPLFLGPHLQWQRAA